MPELEEGTPPAEGPQVEATGTGGDTNAPPPAEGQEPNPEPEKPTGELGEGGERAIKAERDARKAAEKELREARAALKSYEDRDKSELELLRERTEAAEKAAAEAEQAVAAAELAARRAKVSAAKGVPAERLTGVTEEELLASADDLIAWRDQTAPPKRVPSPSGDGLKSGASGAGASSPDPKAAAAEALRRLRATG